ncbi:MAG: lamin tail domain-containing protein [Actinomycetota bacterium]
MSRVPYLNQLGEALDVAIRESEPRRYAVWAGPAVAAAAFVAVFVVGVAILFVRDTVDVAVPTTTPPTTTVAPVTAGELPVQWARAPHSDVLDGLEFAQSMTLTGVDHGPVGYLAVGFEIVQTAPEGAQVGEPGSRGVLLSSSDGVTWRDAGSGVHRSDNVFQNVAFGPDRVALAGQGSDNFVRFWTSPDGLEWEPSEIVDSGTLGGAVAASLAATDGGFVAVGHGIVGDGRDSVSTGVVWRLNESGSWVETIDPSFDGASFNDVTADGGVLLVSGLFETGDGVSDAAIWRSEDGGSTWAYRVLPRVDDGGFVVVSAVAAGPISFVAAGFERADGAIWMSADGETWERVDDPDGVFVTEGMTTRIHDVIATDAGLVATGVAMYLSDSHRVTWVSEDGVEWLRIDLDEPHVIEGSSTYAFDLATDGATVLAVGRERTIDNQGIGAVWISPPPAGIEAIGPFVPEPEPEAGVYQLAIHPSRGVAATGVDVTVDGEAGAVDVVLVGDDGARHERCTIDITYGQGRCTFEVGDLAPGSYVVTIDDKEVFEEQPFEVLPEGSDVVVLGVSYQATLWPLVNMVRVENHGAVDVDISGWWIEETSTDRFLFPDGTVAEAGESIVVIQHSAGGFLTCPEGTATYFHVCFDLDSDGWHGAPLYLYDAAGQEIDSWNR